VLLKYQDDVAKLTGAAARGLVEAARTAT